jgi:hypothetical protein
MLQTSDSYWTFDKYILEIKNVLKDKNDVLKHENNTMELIYHICESIFNARNENSNIDPNTKEGKEILQYKGYTGIKTRHFYNNICSKLKNVQYLEIGTWYGSSSISAIYKNQINALFIDNWSQFGGDSNIFIENIKKFEGDSNCYLIENDCWSVDLESLENKFNIYLYDGAHTEEDHYKSLKYYYPVLEDQFIFMIDDWCWSEVREGTMRAIRDLGLKIHFKHEEFLNSDDLTGMPNHKGKDTWWNGIGIFLLSKP